MKGSDYLSEWVSVIISDMSKHEEWSASNHIIYLSK